MMMTMKWLPMTIAAMMVLASCESDNYDKGTGENSLTTANLMVAYADGDKMIRSIVTDDGDSLVLATPVTAKWVTTADSAYRSVAYYDVTAPGKAEIVSIGKVPTLIPVEADSVKSPKHDPVGFESMWKAKNGRYLNISIWLKVGSTSVEDAHHTIGITHDSTTTAHDGRTTAHLRLLHDQGDVPEKYSSQYFLSIPRSWVTTDSVSCTFDTWTGSVVKTVAMQ